MSRFRIRRLLVMSVLLALPALTCGFGPAFQDLVQRVTALESESGETDLVIEDLLQQVTALETQSNETAFVVENLVQQVVALETELDQAALAIGQIELIERELDLTPTTVLLDDDFEDGIDPAWIQVSGTTQTVVPTSDCTGAYWSRYANCGSLGLHFDEREQYDYLPPIPVAGSFSLYFHDDPADTNAAAWVGMVVPGGQERLGVVTSHCPNTYYISLNAGYHRCTIIPRRLGWHRLEFVRTGMTTRGYFDHILVFETNHSDRTVVERVRVVQEVAGSELSGFAIDDVRFEAFD